MAIDFPNSPSPNQVYTVGTTSWIYSNSCWELVRYGTVGPTGPTGSNGAGLWTVSDTAPTGPSSGSTWYNSTTGKTYVYYDSYWVEVGNTGQITTSHSNSHINGGGDVIDGDRLQLDYVPTNYTRNSAATGATDARDLTAHINSIDTYLGSLLAQTVRVFTTEAVRDAAITSPTEGMHAYLTAPTTAIVDATGLNTSIPTGVQTIYNGSVWVVVTPVGANTDTIGTTANATYTNTLTSGGTNPTVKLVTGTTAMVGLSMNVYASIAGNQHHFASISVTGASSIALADPNGVFTFMAQSATFSTSLSRTFVFTGLTAGVNTFALGYAGVSGGTSSFYQRRLWVSGIA